MPGTFNSFFFLKIKRHSSLPPEAPFIKSNNMNTSMNMLASKNQHRLIKKCGEPKKKTVCPTAAAWRDVNVEGNQPHSNVFAFRCRVYAKRPQVGDEAAARRVRGRRLCNVVKIHRRRYGIRPAEGAGGNASRLLRCL